VRLSQPKGNVAVGDQPKGEGDAKRHQEQVVEVAQERHKSGIRSIGLKA
jgi:hypothetical protein